LQAAHVIAPAIRIIRSETHLGTLHMNTNAGRPDVMTRILDAGLDSVRVSLNSVREAPYAAYFRPRGYRFADVLDSIDRSVSNGCYVSINYLNLPGFTDTPEENAALVEFVGRRGIRMIQWRNLNYDPLRYLGVMAGAGPLGPPGGMHAALNTVRQAYPGLRFGYFNPPKERFDAPL
jgi:pyruvate-formate lyase-activating enzyme